jgi:hypothetical protein
MISAPALLSDGSGAIRCPSTPWLPLHLLMLPTRFLCARGSEDTQFDPQLIKNRFAAIQQRCWLSHLHLPGITETAPTTPAICPSRNASIVVTRMGQ